MGVNKNCLFVLYLFILYFVEVRFLKASQYVRKTITQLHQWRRLLQQGARRRTRTRGHPSSSEHSQADDEELHEPLQSEEEETSKQRNSSSRKLKKVNLSRAAKTQKRFRPSK